MKKLLLFLVFVTTTSLTAFAQSKVGTSSTVFDNSVASGVTGSGDFEGLWLPRVTDTSISGIASLNPPNGLVIFYTPANKFLLRSNNTWVTYLDSAIKSIIAAGIVKKGPALSFKAAANGTAAQLVMANPEPSILQPKSIVCFSLPAAEFPLKVEKNEGYVLTFKVPRGANLTNPATVTISPETPLHERIGINWAVVTDATTITASIASFNGGKQTFPAGYKFYISVTMF